MKNIFLWNLKQFIISIDQFIYNFLGFLHTLISIILYPFKNKLKNIWDFNFRISADDTISATCWRKRKDNPFWNFLRKFIDLLLFFDANHCEESYKSEINGKQHIQ